MKQEVLVSNKGDYSKMHNKDKKFTSKGDNYSPTKN